MYYELRKRGTRLARSSRWLPLALGAFLALAGSWTISSAAMAQPSALLSQKSPDADELVSIAQRTGKVRVIVMLDCSVPAIVGPPDAEAIANLKARVASCQDAVIAAHFGSASNPSAGQGFERGLKRFETTPGFAVNVSLAELEALAADSRVRSISYDRLIPPA